MLNRYNMADTNIKVWQISDTIKCQQLTSEYLQETLNLMDISFFRHANVCKVFQIVDDPEALKELRKLTLATAQDGITIIAIDTTKNKVVGAAFNKLQVKDIPAFEVIASSWKNYKSKAIVQFMADVDNLCNLFEHCKIDCILELMFLTTLPEYGGKGIGKKLWEATIEIGRLLASGINVKKSINGQNLPLQPAPKIISAILTTVVTQIISKQLGFKIVAERNYDEYEFEGKNFANVIGKETPKLTLVYKSLQ